MEAESETEQGFEGEKEGEMEGERCLRTCKANAYRSDFTKRSGGKAQYLIP